MYRQYENPRALEAELEKVKAEFDDLTASGKIDDDLLNDYRERIADLTARINFAWQDEEYDIERY